MKHSILLAAGVAASLAGACSRGPDHVQPGMWEFRLKVTQVDAPGATPEMLAMARAQLNQEQTVRNCITPDHASNPLGMFRDTMTRPQPGANCTTEEDVFSGGTIRVHVTCRAANGQSGQGTLAMDGRFNDITLLATLSVGGEGLTGGGPQSVRLTSELRGIRIGDCPGGQGGAGNSLRR